MGLAFLVGLGVAAGFPGGTIPAGISTGLAGVLSDPSVELGVTVGVPLGVTVGLGVAVAVGDGVALGVDVGVRLGVGVSLGWELVARRGADGAQLADADGVGWMPGQVPDVLDGPGSWLAALESTEPPGGCVPLLLSGRFSAPEFEIAPDSWLSANPPATAMTMAAATAVGRSHPYRCSRAGGRPPARPGRE
jgi:hypothetical protein